MSARVKLCAIARNEGPYLPDWIFHHLHFGFDAIELLLNGTDDGSGRIVQRIAEKYPQVTKRNGDRLLEKCLSASRSFQFAAYARQARRAEREGFSHVAFLDLDEYWTPRDFVTPIQDFLPSDPDVNVVSFPWCLDVPEEGRLPFAEPFVGPVILQLDRHVKSVGRLDDSLKKPMIHTFKTHGGKRMLVRDPFPAFDQRAQKSGSMVADDYLHSSWHELPEAFVLHAINRSQQEYLGSLTKGQWQTGSPTEFKLGRTGYVATDAPLLEFEPPSRALRRYQRRRKAFQRRVRLDELSNTARRRYLERAELLALRVQSDPEVGGRLAEALRGTHLEFVSDPSHGG